MIESSFPSPTELVVAPPSPRVAAALALLDPAAVDGSAQLDVIVAWERLARWVAAGQARAVAALAEQRGMGRSSLADEDVYAEVGAALALSPRSAAGLVEQARALRGRLPAVWRALADGRLSQRLARIAVEETDAADRDVCAAVDAALAADIDALTRDPDAAAAADAAAADADAAGSGAGGMVDLPPTRWRTRVRRVVLTVAPGVAAVRAERAAAGRRVELWPGPDATASLVAVLPAVDALRVDRALDALAGRHDRADGRGKDARRADALVAAVLTAAADRLGPAAAATACEVQVTVGLPTLLGLADSPAELTGYGPVPAPLARALAADGAWRRLVVDPQTGALLDRSPCRYRPGAALSAYVAARDRTCRFPGCTARAQRCDGDHAHPYRDGGRTVRDNLCLLCRRHHRLKTFRAWGLRRDGQAWTWTSPTGRRHTIHPHPHPRT